jgi:polar amino acid transport system substrate-binding protein
MKNLGLLALGALLLFAGTAQGQTPLHVLTSAQTAPKTYIDHGKPTGYLVEIAAEALRRAGYLPDIEALPWARAVAEAEAGNGLLAGFSRTAERDRLFEYSDALYEDRVVLVTRRGADFPFAGLADLAGRTIGLPRAGSYGPELDAALGQFNAVRDSGHCERLKMLGAGRIDGAIISGGVPAVLFNAAAAGLDPRDLVIHAVPVAIDLNYMAIAKSRPDGRVIMDRVNLALAGMARDGATRRIIAAYELDAGL